MRQRSITVLSALLLVTAFFAAPAGASHNADQHSPNASLLFNSPNATGAINSDLAFWGNRAYAGNYDGFRIFDISNPATPQQLVDFRCRGPQVDPIVWQNKLLFLAVDSVMTSADCGAPPAANPETPTGWEGVRIFDVSDPTSPKYVKGVYTDCGAHTISLYPKSRNELLIYVSSYPLRPGPTCGPVRGPATGNSALHEKISVIKVPVNAPAAAKVIAQPTVSYPGDPDNAFDPVEHGVPAGVFNPLTACHDIGVFVKLRLAAGACAEQTQLWRIKPNGIPDTEHPIWVFDDNTDVDGPGGGDVAVDFWHTARFTWDGKYVQADDESFGDGCPPTTEWADGTVNDTGRPHLIRVSDGQRVSFFDLPRTEASAYCSVHQGNFVPVRGRYLSVNAWYMGGMNVIDWTDPANPVEVAYYDIAPAGATGSDNWSAYWYEGPSLPGDSLTIYGTDGVHNPATGRGFQVFRVDLAADEVNLGHLNPQTQEDPIT
ncbi:MAG: hypothetical protein ACRDTM_05840 [Micromonosporaceae bacterium]